MSDVSWFAISYGWIADRYVAIDNTTTTPAKRLTLSQFANLTIAFILSCSSQTRRVYDVYAKKKPTQGI